MFVSGKLDGQKPKKKSCLKKPPKHKFCVTKKRSCTSKWGRIATLPVFCCIHNDFSLQCRLVAEHFPRQCKVTITYDISGFTLHAKIKIRLHSLNEWRSCYNIQQRRLLFPIVDLRKVLIIRNMSTCNNECLLCRVLKRLYIESLRRSQWPRGLRCESAAAVLGLRV
jgi:hypothetical protein